MERFTGQIVREDVAIDVSGWFEVGTNTGGIISWWGECEARNVPAVQNGEAELRLDDERQGHILIKSSTARSGSRVKVVFKGDGPLPQ